MGGPVEAAAWEARRSSFEPRGFAPGPGGAERSVPCKNTAELFESYLARRSALQAVQRSPEAAEPRPLDSPAAARSGPSGKVVQRFGEELLSVELLALIGTVALGLLYRNWPAGRSIRDLISIFYQVGFRNGMTFANFANWNSAAIIQLATSFAAGNNGLTAQQWVTIAGRVANDDAAGAAGFAQIGGWTWAGLGPLSTAFQAGANGLTPQQWAAIASRVPNNDHAGAAAFAQLGGWTWAGGLDALTQAFQGNAPGLTAVQWSGIAGRVGQAAEPVVPIIAANLPMNAPQMAQAARIYVRSGSLAHVNAWIDAGANLPAAPQAPIPRAAAGPVVHALPPGGGPAPAQYPLDPVLGAGAHLQIRALTGGNNRVYSPHPFVTNHAQTLITAGANRGQARALMVDFCTNIARATVFNRAVTVAQQMFANNVPFAEIQNFINNHPGQALAANFQPAIADLVTRPGVTAPALSGALGLLSPLGNPGMANLLANQFAPTPGLTLPRLEARLADFVNLAPAGQGVAIGNVANEFQPVEQSVDARVLAGTMSNAGRDWILYAFRLLGPATRPQMTAFLGDARVNGTFANGHATNAANWLYRFARYHAGAPAGGFANQNVPVMAGGAARTVVINNWIIDHVQRRHTYEHYRLIPAIINRGGPSTIINPPTNAAGIAGEITNILGNAAVAAAYPWNPAVPINVGAVQLRLGLIQGGGGNYRLTQYYYFAAPGLGDVVPANALTAIAARFPFLVY